MELKSITISGYRNVSNVKLKLDNITSMLSLNNFGKSNVLKGIDFGCRFIQEIPSEKSFMMLHSSNIPINIYMENTNFHFEFESEVSHDNKLFSLIYGYEFKWGYGDENPLITKEYLKVKDINNSLKYTQLIKRENNRALYKHSETGRCSSVVKIQGNELVINKLLAFDDLYYIELIKEINSLDILIEDHLDTKAYCTPKPVIRKGTELESRKNGSLSRDLYMLKKNHPNQYSLLVDAFTKLFPEITAIVPQRFKLTPTDQKTSKTDDYVLLNEIFFTFVEDKNLREPISIEVLSDGARRILMILTEIIYANIKGTSLIAIEEPENSVHPRLFQSYIEIISQLLDNCKLIITSHSPYMMSYFNPSKIYVGVNRKPGVAEFFKLSNSGVNRLMKESEKYDTSTGDYLFELLTDPESNIKQYLDIS